MRSSKGDSLMLAVVGVGNPAHSEKARALELRKIHSHSIQRDHSFPAAEQTAAQQSSVRPAQAQAVEQVSAAYYG